jgi:[NiFe] hydrogenase diaphorase moiety small subunit
VFGFEGRGILKRIAVDSLNGLGNTDLAVTDEAASLCPTGSIVVKRVGFKMPYGTRKYDAEPIGVEIEKKGRANG